MNEEETRSPAFMNAELQSERLRIIGVLGFISSFLVITVVRVFIVQTASVRAAVPGLVLATALLIFEALTLRKVGVALQNNSVVPVRFWIFSTVIETALPACALVLLGNLQAGLAYQTLSSPPVLVFFIFIILSTLRLSPWISILAGTVASVSYLCAALYLGWRPPVPGTPAPPSHSAVSLNAITLLAGGVVAAAVAEQIRKYVRAALREAETKRQLEMVQHDLEVARSIQQALLPGESPQISGFDIAGWNRPADDTGGDYFDWKVLPDGKVVISLADVTGHGIGPAILASVCHAYARSSFGAMQDLSRAVARINQDLGADLTPGRFVTFAAALCCPGCADIEMLSAGHGPIFVYSRCEDRFTEMHAQALPLGILPTFESDLPARLQLRVGDFVLLATDGFFEWENNVSEQFGLERLEDVLRASRDCAASEIIAHLYRAVVSFSKGTRQQDDLTAVVIKRVGEAA